MYLKKNLIQNRDEYLFPAVSCGHMHPPPAHSVKSVEVGMRTWVDFNMSSTCIVMISGPPFIPSADLKVPRIASKETKTS